METVEAEDPGLRWRDVRGGHLRVDLAGGRYHAGAVPEDRNALEIVPGPRVAVAAGAVVRLPRNDLELSASVDAGAPVDPDQLLARKGARLLDEIGVTGARRRRARRERSGRRRQQRRRREEPEEPPPHARA